MRQYIIRILSAWLLLNVAQRLVKDAEQLLTKSMNTPAVEAGTAEPVLEGVAVDG